MAFIPTPNTAQAVLHYAMFGEPIVNTLWFTGVADYTATMCEDLAAALVGWWEATLFFQQSEDIRLDDVTVYAMHVQDGAVAVLEHGETGNAPSASLPGQDCMVITFQTAARGRSGRGRNFISGLPLVTRVGNSWEIGVRTGVKSAYEDLNAAVTGINGSQHSVVSFVSNGAPRATGRSLPVTSYVVREAIETQQRRSER